MGVFIRWNGTAEWNGGMEQWNGTVEWNNGMEQWNDHAHVHCNCTTILHTDGLATVTTFTQV